MTVELSTRDDAVARAERIRAGIRSMADLQQDIADAYHARDWVTLGYESWDTYVSGEFGGSMPRLDRAERRELVVNLRAEGLSTRAIAAATGVSAMQVSRDARDAPVPNVTGDRIKEPVPVVGIDGKTYEANRPPITPEELEELKPENLPAATARPASRKTPLPKFAAGKVGEIWRLTGALQRIVKDERFGSNRESIRQHCESELKLAEANIAAFREALGIEKAAPAG